LSDSSNTLLGNKIDRPKKEKAELEPSKEFDLKEIKRKIDVEKEKERRKDVQRKNNQQPQQEVLIPNNTLFVENLNQTITESVLTTLFSQHSGFK
jgi:RNA recognition motif-containing protein